MWNSSSVPASSTHLVSLMLYTTLVVLTILPSSMRSSVGAVQAIDVDTSKATQEQQRRRQQQQQQQQLQQPNLPFGDINVLVVTDVHSWVGGHGHKEPNTFNADYGDVISFFERLKEYCDQTDRDLWFVDNGDWIEGTALSIDGDTSYLVPLLEKVPLDVVNTGNHELYHASVIEDMKKPGGFIDWWGSRHLSSNILMTDDTQKPLSNLYHMLHGKHSSVLVFGFIYDLLDPSPLVTIAKVETVVTQTWFQKALTKEKYDAILVMAHMGTDDPWVPVLLNAIREYAPEYTPIQFITGHTHFRRYSVVDSLSTAVESGRYLETIGFVSFPTIDTAISTLNGESSSSLSLESGDNTTTTTAATTTTTTTRDLFQHVFLDARVETLASTLAVQDLETPLGKEVSLFIQKTRSRLGLDKRLGCSPQDYHINISMSDENSIWRLYRDEVVPSQLETDSNVNRAIIVDQGSWRYDLFAGENTYDDIVAVSPFNEPVSLLGKLPCSVILALNQSLNSNSTTPNYYETLPAFILAGTVEDGAECELYVHDFKLELIQRAVLTINPNVEFKPTPTNLTSTIIWTSFVQDRWPCPGDTSVNIPWLNSQSSSSMGSSGEDQSDPINVVVVVIFGIVVLCGGLVTCFVILEHLCCLGLSSDDLKEEINAFHNGSGDDVNDDDNEEEEDAMELT